MRFLVGIFIFTIASSSFAAKSEVSLFVSNHLGYRKQEILRVESSRKISYNGIEIPQKLLPKIQKVLSSLHKMPQEKKRFCYGNQYIYTLIESGKKKEIHACAEGKEFARVAAAFYEVQQVLRKGRK